ncbi:beta-taxilin [Carica papaya]|uniref:beta-taxilin n=1 Tax=Carica papaya TaxID=3649 RepID=UPI000B8CD58D|nr:beta-taxilin [Carica papaya]
MENSGANQLPEVDSLPDGFVDSPTESLAPPTPTLDQEKPLDDYKEDSISGLDCSNESLQDMASNDSQATQGREEKIGKLRTFPVPLSEAESNDVPIDLVQVPNMVVVEEKESSLGMSSSSNTVNEPDGVSECTKQGQDQVNCGTETSNEGGSETNTTDLKEISSSENIDLLKTRKLETAETKRKIAKRTFKSEKDFLEFTLKYQQVLSERDAAIAVRDKLESLCRELQRQNKMLMDECKRVTTEGQNLRFDLSTKFENAIKVCFKSSNSILFDRLRSKLKQLLDQHALSEQQYAQKLKQKTLELQLSDLKIKQHEEKLAQEQSRMKLYAEQVSQLLATEKNLRLQLTADGEKFQQFQDALLKSNEVFATFKQEIEKMSKSIKELKKENAFLKSKSEKSDVTLIELVEERERLKKQLEKMKNQKEKLESLCRSLQAERKQNPVGSSRSDSVSV